MLNQPAGRFLHGGKTFKLDYPLSVKTSEHEEIIVPAGFVTDFASVPWFFRRLFPPIGKYTAAAVVHDYLYSKGILTRAQADFVFRVLMARYKCSPITYWTMWAGLRVGGWVGWLSRKNRQSRSMFARNILRSAIYLNKIEMLDEECPEGIDGENVDGETRAVSVAELPPLAMPTTRKCK